MVSSMAQLGVAKSGLITAIGHGPIDSVDFIQLAVRIDAPFNRHTEMQSGTAGYVIAGFIQLPTEPPKLLQRFCYIEAEANAVEFRILPIEGTSCKDSSGGGGHD